MNPSPFRRQPSFLNQCSSPSALRAAKSNPFLLTNPNFSEKNPPNAPSPSLAKIARYSNAGYPTRMGSAKNSPIPPSSKRAGCPIQMVPTAKPSISRTNKNHRIPLKLEHEGVSSSGYSRWVILGIVSLGFALFLIGIEEQKALALGPEGPLLEEFWDNMRRYGLYFLTVSTGVIYTVFQPILELLKNPISAILIITILGGTVYLLSQVLSAMVGISDFSYDYGY